MTTRAAALTLAAATVLSPAALAGTADAAAAGCTPNKVQYSISDVRGRLTLTHVMKAHVPANTERTFDEPLPVVRVVASRFDNSRGADMAALHRLAQKAAARTPGAVEHLTLAKPGAHSAPGRLGGGDSITFHPAPKEERYALWHAYRVWDGQWSRSDCGPTGRTSSAFGARWTSFETRHVSGAADCDRVDTARGGDLRRVIRQACALAYR